MCAIKWFAVLCVLCPAFGQRVGVPTDDLDKLSVDELFSVQVTSVGRKAQKLSKAAAAVCVLTAEDIRRSGATSIPEALQWVPGLTVRRVDGRSWIVSARGGARLYSDKILVMIDGRSLYTPLFSGVIWDAVHVPMEDIERIEVVRGPGAVMWGPNAVNGVINIITIKARSAKGALVSAATGNELRAQTVARWGSAPSDRLAYRVTGDIDYRKPAYKSPGFFTPAENMVYRDPALENLDAATGSLGFRAEGQATEKNQWVLQGNLFKMDRQDPVGYPGSVPGTLEQLKKHTDYEGGYIQAGWTRTASAGNESSLQFSYDRTNLNYPFTAATVHNLTLDYQKRQQTGERNELYWGAGYQQYWDHTLGSPYTRFNPANSVYRAGDVVVRDEFQLVPGRLLGSGGVRVDYSSYHRVEYQPSLRLIYTPSANQSVWLSASRAVRVPSRLDRDVYYSLGDIAMGDTPVTVAGVGSLQMRSEVARSVEAGYRFQSGQRWSVDGSLFWTYYGRARTLQGPLVPTLSFVDQQPVLQYFTTATNAGSGRSYGGEIWGTLQVRSGWRLIPSYSYLAETRWLPSSSTVNYSWDGHPTSVPHQVLLRSQHNLFRTMQLDLMAKGSSRDRTYGLPGALLFEARMGWRPTHSGELSFAVQNLANRHILEGYAEGPAVAIPLRRTFLLKWTQRL